ncbi:MAG: hypothetical protein JNM07_00940 [Phycisphaerae bacterium]|nr:hypothetical protein [Phycisphaerae bacterium]
MRIVISPYHLTTREPPAMVALLLASRAVTMLPTPRAGTDRASVREAGERTPRLLQLMESWAWCAPLFASGVASAIQECEGSAPLLEDVLARIETEPEFEPLRPLMRSNFFAHEESYLDAICGDVLKGGPDPGVSVPVTAALDALASSRGMVVARSDSDSLVQRAERRAARRVFAVAVPVLLEASGRRVLEARAVLADTLAALGRAMSAMFESPEHADAVRAAAAAYRSAFAQSAERLLRGDEQSGNRTRAGFVAITGIVLRENASLLAAAEVAARSFRAPSAQRPASSQAKVAEPELRAIVVRSMSAAPHTTDDERAP